MKGDFSRFSFKPQNHYTQVRRQQGRVDLDADWNEYIDIQEYLDETIHTDVIGPCGAPKNGGGFKIEGVTPDGSDLQVSAGRIYVDGLLCTLENPGSYLAQPDDPAPPELTPADGRADLVVLDVWKRHITALEDPAIREVALGGPDTTTRVKTVWQLRVLEGMGDWQCGDELPDHSALAPGLEARGRLTSFADPSVPPDDICDVPTSGGYRGLENRTYRVEIHDPGDITSATFKWSRDNGAVVCAIEAFDPGDPLKVKLKSQGRDQVLGLRVGDWVEVLGDTSELHGTAGTLAQIDDLDEARRELTLSVDVSAHAAEGHPRVRRWDQESAAIPVSASEIELEDGVKVAFSDGAFLSGDYWVFTARTATAGVENLSDAPPMGIRHHFCALALLVWRQETGADGENFWEANLTDCRPEFPWLTDLPEACDLRFHNKHLHGWGIVCGLQVYCGPDGGQERRNVTTRPGYAIDCEGSDLIIPDDQPVITDVMTEIARLEEEGASILNNSGSGEVFLTLEPRNGTPGVRVEPYDPAVTSLRGRLENTLLMDFYNDCIRQPLELLRQLIAPPDDDEGQLVSPARERLITLMNLIIQLINPAHGSRVFLSPREDQLLRELYLLVRSVLQSNTFCAMFEDARGFPDYPFPEHGISTIFGRAVYGRVRIHPGERLGVTTGVDNQIHVFDLESGQMVSALEMPGGAGVVVRDVAFSPDGELLYAVASTPNNENTIFAVAEGDPRNPTWRPMIVLCDIRLVTLATTAQGPGLVYAIGLGTGLYELDPDQLVNETTPEPRNAFNASGHLGILTGDEQTRAYASANQPGADSARYDRIFELNLNAAQPNPPFFLLRNPNGQNLSGADDVRAVRVEQSTILTAVVDTPEGGKALCMFTASPNPTPTLVPLEDTAIRLGHFPGSPYLMVSLEDSFRLVLVEIARRSLVDGYHFPVQISPIGIAAAPETENVYVLNAVSNTLNSVPAVYLDPSRPGPDVSPVPGTVEFLEALTAYRNGIFAAFIDLLGGILQYLKDCLCDHFLVNCPDCSEDEKIYLAVVSIRNQEVYKVCNFSGRKYVKSFPTVDYWLSTIPIMPLISKAIEQFCCAALPGLFARYQAPRQDAYQAPVRGVQMRSGMTRLQTTDLRSSFSRQSRTVRTATGLSADWLGNVIQQTVAAPIMRTAAVRQSEAVGKPVASVQNQMEKVGIEVVEVKAYDPSQGAANVANFLRSQAEVPAGARVILHEQAGVVRYYEVVKEAPQAPGEAIPAAKLRNLEKQLKTRDSEIQTLREQLQALEGRQAALEDQASPEKVVALETELQELRTFRKEVQDFIKRSSG
jgi:hypothetical protein